MAVIYVGRRQTRSTTNVSKLASTNLHRACTLVTNFFSVARRTANSLTSEQLDDVDDSDNDSTETYDVEEVMAVATIMTECLEYNHLMAVLRGYWPRPCIDKKKETKERQTDRQTERRPPTAAFIQSFRHTCLYCHLYYQIPVLANSNSVTSTVKLHYLHFPPLLLLLPNSNTCKFQDNWFTAQIPVLANSITCKFIQPVFASA